MRFRLPSFCSRSALVLTLATLLAARAGVCHAQRDLKDIPDADPELERALIELLDQGGADVVRALGRVGTAPSVLPLQGVQAAALPLTELSRASTEALRAIRARLVGERGTLSVPELLGGELADATNPLRAGRVALAPAEGGGARSHRAEQRDARPRFATPSSR